MGLQWLTLVALVGDELRGASQCLDCQESPRGAMESEEVDVAFAAIAQATEILHPLMG